MKVENSIYEKRIQKKKERIGNLEKRMSDMREQNNNYKIELDKLKAKFTSAQLMSEKNIKNEISEVDFNTMKNN